MADITINDLAEVTTIASGDFIPIWRTANGDTRKITRANIFGGLLTGGGTIATGGYTLTVPATGTAVLLDATQTLTNKTLTTPTIASFTNATHDHTNAAGGGTLGTNAISNSAITNAKLANMAQSTIKGRASGAGTGVATDLTATQVRTILNVEDGADVTDATNVLAAGAVMTSGNQTVAGEKTFTGDTDIGSYGTGISSFAHEPRLAVSESYDGISSHQMNNSSTGTGADTRFAMVDSDKDHYFAMALPGKNNVGGLLGQTKNTAAFLFNNSSASAERNLAIGTVRETDLIFSTDNTERIRVTSGGDVGVGVASPQGIMHAHDGTGGFMFVTKTSINGTAQEIIPNGTGDVARWCRITWVLWTTDNAFTYGGTSNVANNSSVEVFTDTPSTAQGVTFAVSSAGALTVQRTTGSKSHNLAASIVWL